MGSWLGPLQNAGRVLLDFAYPPYCVVCKADIEAVPYCVLGAGWRSRKLKVNMKIQRLTICCVKVIYLKKILL